MTLFLVAFSASASADTIQGRWKLTVAEDLRADGSVARYPWGRHPVGSIVVDGGACYVQIMSGDVPSFSTGATPATEQMKAALPRSEKFSYLSVLDTICPSRQCPLTIDSIPLAWDHAHLTGEGSVYAMERLAPMLELRK